MSVALLLDQQFTTNATAFTFTLPAPTPGARWVLAAIIRANSVLLTPPAPWVVQDVRRASTSGTGCQCSLLYTDSPTAGDVTLQTDSSARMVVLAWEVTGHDPTVPTSDGNDSGSTSVTSLAVPTGLTVGSGETWDVLAVATGGGNDPEDFTLPVGYDTAPTDDFMNITSTADINVESGWGVATASTGPLSASSTTARRMTFQLLGIKRASTSTPAQGSASGTITWAGTSTGKRITAGLAAGAIAWAGIATGATVHDGTASGATVWAGTAQGQAPAIASASGSATGGIAWAGTAQGLAPVVAGASGSASGAVAWAGTAQGVTGHAGTASGAITWGGTATGQAPTVGGASGSATGAITWTGTAAGTTAHTGQATGQVTWAGAAQGSTTPTGTATGTIVWAGTATGGNNLRDITVTATLTPRRWDATLPDRRWTGTLTPRRWTGALT